MNVCFDHTPSRSRVGPCGSYLQWFSRPSFYDVARLHSVVPLIPRCPVCLDVFLCLRKFIPRLVAFVRVESCRMLTVAFVNATISFLSLSRSYERDYWVSLIVLFAESSCSHWFSFFIKFMISMFWFSSSSQSKMSRYSDDRFCFFLYRRKKFLSCRSRACESDTEWWSRIL